MYLETNFTSTFIICHYANFARKIRYLYDFILVLQKYIIDNRKNLMLTLKKYHETLIYEAFLLIIQLNYVINKLKTGGKTTKLHYYLNEYVAIIRIQ